MVNVTLIIQVLMENDDQISYYSRRALNGVPGMKYMTSMQEMMVKQYSGIQQVLI
jgi:hypothetical protein